MSPVSIVRLRRAWDRDVDAKVGIRRIGNTVRSQIFARMDTSLGDFLRSCSRKSFPRDGNYVEK